MTVAELVEALRAFGSDVLVFVRTDYYGDDSVAVAQPQVVREHVVEDHGAWRRENPRFPGAVEAVVL
jgi:hypothetical protein